MNSPRPATDTPFLVQAATVIGVLALLTLYTICTLAVPVAAIGFLLWLGGCIG